MKYEVVVELKEEVLDTQGRAIFQTLHRLGYDKLKSVKASKRFVVELEESGQDMDALVKKLASEHLANTVSETFSFRKL